MDAVHVLGLLRQAQISKLYRLGGSANIYLFDESFITDTFVLHRISFLKNLTFQLI